jgi:hypothetical protein
LHLFLCRHGFFSSPVRSFFISYKYYTWTYSEKEDRG